MGLGSEPVADRSAPWFCAAGDLFPARRSASMRRMLGGLGQAPFHVALLIGCYTLYRVISLSVPRLAPAAHAHAQTLVRIEQRLGLFFEPRTQQAVLAADLQGPFGLHLHGGSLGRVFSAIYAGGQLPWLLAMFLWLYLFRSEHFARVRNMAIALCTMAITFAAVYPVAPPRFALAGAPYHVADLTGLPMNEQVLVRVSGFDPYASLPSVHVLWALLTGMGLFLGGPRGPSRYLAWVFPAAVGASVVITGNHYLLDVAASLFLFLACLLAGVCWRRVQPRLPRLVSVGARRGAAAAAGSATLDASLLLCALVGMLLLFAGSMEQLVLGGCLLVGGAVASELARRRPALDRSRSRVACRADWWCGMLLVIGATAIGAGDLRMRMAGSLIWAIAVVAPLVARLRPADALRLLAHSSHGASFPAWVCAPTPQDETITPPVG